MRLIILLAIVITLVTAGIGHRSTNQAATKQYLWGSHESTYSPLRVDDDEEDNSIDSIEDDNSMTRRSKRDVTGSYTSAEDTSLENSKIGLSPATVRLKRDMSSPYPYQNNAYGLTSATMRSKREMPSSSESRESSLNSASSRSKRNVVGSSESRETGQTYATVRNRRSFDSDSSEGSEGNMMAPMTTKMIAKRDMSSMMTPMTTKMLNKRDVFSMMTPMSTRMIGKRDVSSNSQTRESSHDSSESNERIIGRSSTIRAKRAIHTESTNPN